MIRSLHCSPLTEIGTGCPNGTGLLRVPSAGGGGGGGGGGGAGSFRNVAVTTFGAFITSALVREVPVRLPLHDASFTSTLGSAVSLTRVPWT
jgi:hypothetical protein